MRNHRLLVAMTVFNVLLLMFPLGQTRSDVAEGPAPALRDRALAIDDDYGSRR
jgi:hypothetical protein